MAGNDQAPQPQFGIQTIYVKDISLEMPLGAALFSRNWKPQVSIDLNTSSSKFQDSYEVVLSITVTVKLEEQTAALIEIQQAGLFAANAIDDELLRKMLGIAAPNTLFPYAREAIDNLCGRACIPAIKLQPVNFEALYMRAREEAQAKQDAPTDTQ